MITLNMITLEELTKLREQIVDQLKEIVAEDPKKAADIISSLAYNIPLAHFVVWAKVNGFCDDEEGEDGNE